MLQQEKRQNIGNFKIQTKIGKGSYASVFLCEDPSSSTPVAVKAMHRDLFNDNIEVSFKNEITSIQNMDHKNVIKVLNSFDEVNYEFDGTSYQAHVIIQEYCSGGSLEEIFTKYGKKLTAPVIRFFMIQLLESLEYIHNLDICHRDIKEENLVIDSSATIKLIDFQFASKFKEELLDKICGSLKYQAPEILEGQKYQGDKVDIFAAGVILFRLVLQKYPFFKAGRFDYNYLHLYQLKDVQKFWSKHFNEELINQDIFNDPDFRNLIETMMARDPVKRTTAQAIQQHVWMKGKVATREEVIEMVGLAQDKNESNPKVEENEKNGN